MFKKISFALALLLLLNGSQLKADPLDEVYYKTYYIITLGNVAESSVESYKTSLLQDVGGVMPKNLKIGMGTGGWFMFFTQDHYLDYIFDPYYSNGFQSQINSFYAQDVKTGIMLNGMPWGDNQADQSVDTLHNYLEIFDNGSLLQVDRNGNIRNASLTQDPTIDEQAGSFSPFLEMQLTLSRLCTTVQDYFHRNNRMASRHWAWQREEHPDLIVFASTSSEFAMNTAANHEYCDYSIWTKQEFRQWLGGTGLYEGEAQYASLTDFNNAFGLSYASWDDVEPPTATNWTAGTYWSKWHDFRVRQVTEMTKSQIHSSVEAGLSPDRVYGHQIPATPGSSADLYRLYATPWTTTFCTGGSNGITTYGSNAYNTSIFSGVSTNDPNWGIFEYNPLSTSEATNRNALEATWNYGCHIISPYLWAQGGQPTYEIEGTAFEPALRDFIADHQNDQLTAMEAWEVDPESRDAIWAMSESDDVEVFNDISGNLFDTGQLTGTTSGTDPYMTFELDETSHYLKSDAYYSVSFRMYLAAENAGDYGEFFWTDEFGTNYSSQFTPKAGWHVYRINLSLNPDWREKNIQSIRLDPTIISGIDFELDWVRMHANHCWHFDAPGEVYTPLNIDSPVVSAGTFSGTDNNGDGFFHLATDVSTSSEDADRAFINADFYKIMRFRITASDAGAAQIYFRRRGSGYFVQIGINVEAGTHTYEIDMSQNPEWYDQVVHLRLDPVNTAGVNFSVDYLNINPQLLSPRPLTIDPVIYSSQPKFTWDKPVETQSGIPNYHFRMATDFEMNNVVLEKTGLQSGELLLEDGPTQTGLYWWQLQAGLNGTHSSSWSVPMPVYLHRWEFDNIEDAIGLNNLDSPAIVDGVWSATINGGDPFLRFRMGTGMGVNADVYRYLKYRIRLTGTPGTATTQVFFFKYGEAPYAHTLSTPIDGEWHDVIVDLSEHSEWYGNAYIVRLDPTSGTVGNGATIELDSAEFLAELPGEPVPTQSSQPWWKLY